MRFLILLFFLLQCVHAPPQLSPEAPPLPQKPEVRLEPQFLVNGSVGKVTLQGVSASIKEPPRLSCPGTAFKPAPFFLFEGAWIQLFPVDFHEKPQIWHCEVLVEESLLPFTVRIQEGDYPSETLRVAPRKTRPLPRDQKRIAREFAKIRAIYADSSPSPLWASPVPWPIKSPMTSSFGSRRIYNGHLASYHGGLDLRAAVGTPIKTPLRGKIVLAEDLFFTGNTVILDHGAHFYSLYAHLDAIHPDIKKGVGQQMAEVGDLLGQAGRTGRVTGPHLHWQLMVRGVKISPLTFMSLFGESPDPTL